MENSLGVLEVLEVLDSWLHMSQCAASDLLPLALFKVLIKPAEQAELRLNHLSKIKLVNTETLVHFSHKTAGSMLEWFIGSSMFKAWHNLEVRSSLLALSHPHVCRCMPLIWQGAIADKAS